MLYIIFSILLLLTALLVILLKISLKKSIYSYRNIMYVAGIVFLVSTCTQLFISIMMNLARGDGLSEINSALFLKEFARYFVYNAIPVFLVLTIAVGISNVSLIIHEGLRVKNVVGVALSGSFVIATIALYLISQYFHADHAQISGFWLKIDGVIHDIIVPFLCCAICYVECLMFGMIVMGWIAAKQVPKYDKDYIIILGCSISKQGGLLPLLKARTNRAIKYAWEQEIASGKPCKFVPSGGQGKDEVISEGSAMELYLKTHGAEDYEVFPEKKSRNTDENFAFSRDIILEQKKDARVAFATTNYHVFRSGLIARRNGFDNIEAISSKTKWYFWPNGFAREMIAIIVLMRKVHIVALALLLINVFFGI